MNKLIIISSHPKKNLHTHKESALASFNKNLTKKLKSKLNFVILADNENKKDKAIKVWKKNDLFSFLRIINKILKYKDYQKILIQYEWNLFGNNFVFIFLFVFFLFFIRLFNKKIFIVLHGVNFDFTSVFGKNIKSYFLNVGSWFFYFLVILMVDKVIVTEKKFKDILEKKYFKKNKIVFIPHGVEEKRNIKKNFKTKKVINLGFLGFLNPYKGPLELIELFNQVKTDKVSLTFYGGVSKNLLNNKDYQKYLKKIYSLAKKINVKITGFLDEKQISKVFNWTDLIIFPYKSFLSSSGMLALTFLYEKPFILSRPLEGYFESPDFKEALKETGLKKEDFIFDFNKKSFEQRLQWARNNLEKLSQFSKAMKEKRSWDKIAKIYLQILEEKR